MLAVLALVWSISAFAIEPVVLSRAPIEKPLLLLENTGYYVGTNTPLDLTQAAQLPDSVFASIEKTNPVRPLRTTWFRFSVRNDDVVARSLVFDLNQLLFNQVDLQASIGEKVVKVVRTGLEKPRDSWDLDHYYFAFHLDVPAGETLTVNMAINSSFAVLFMPTLVDEKSFVREATFSGRFVGGILGMLYAAIFFWVIYILYTRKIGQELIILLFALCSYFSVMYLAGVVSREMLDDYPQWNNSAYLLIHGIQGIVFVFMLRQLYQLATWAPLVNRLMLVFAAADLLCLLMIPFVEKDLLIVVLVACNSVLLFCSLLLALFSLALQGKENILTSVGIVLFALLVFYSSLMAYGYFPYSLVARYGYEIGLTFQADCFFIAAVARIFSAEHGKQQAEGELIKLNAEMQARREFVDKVTHDIKSPLSAVIGAVELLREPVSPEKRDRYLSIIQGTCNSVMGIIDNILSYSRMQMGNNGALHTEQFDVIAVMRDIETAIGLVQNKKFITFYLNISADMPSVVIGDKLKFSRILNNLLTNAFKFTDEGCVSLKVEVLEKTAHSLLATFVVEDTGIGMSEDFIARAFDPYVQESTPSRSRTGFGLGLSICKQLVTVMGGRIEVQSVLGHGTRFTVTLPFDLPQ